MSLMVDITADQPPLPGRLAVQDLASEEVVALAEELVTYHQHFAPLFYRREQREWAELYLRGLLTADVPRKNVEAMALRLLGVGPHAERQVRALQQFVGEGRWDDDALLAEHQRLVNETLGEEDGVLIVDGSDFPKHGDHSAGVAPQWCGHSGKKDNCQAGVFLGYASRKGATFLDRRLYLPESWFEEDLNNAHLASIATYFTCVPGFQRELKAVGGDLTAFYVRVRALAPNASEVARDLTARVVPRTRDVAFGFRGLEFAWFSAEGVLFGTGDSRQRLTGSSEKSNTPTAIRSAKKAGPSSSPF